MVHIDVPAQKIHFNWQMMDSAVKVLTRFRPMSESDCSSLIIGTAFIIKALKL